MAVDDADLLSSYAGLLTLATLSIYAGSFGSLTFPKDPSKKQQKKSLLHRDDEDSDEEEDIPDRLSAADAYLFPVLGSVALFGLYLIVKHLGTEWINAIFGWYFTLTGVLSVWKCSVSLSRTVLGREIWHKFSRNKILILRGPKELLSVSMRTPSLLLFPLATIPSILYHVTTIAPSISDSSTKLPSKSALLTDILALSFAHNALSVLKLDSFQTGIILLSGLFLYDIWWVFGTEVMVKVATSIDAPIKILWPKSLHLNTTNGFTMLGLGDIVVPGLFISLALRYDLNRAVSASTHSGKRNTLSSDRRSFSKPYFYAALTSYVMGLCTTMGVMHTWGAAQPALLYLSPACILSFLITAVARGELGEAWRWSDEPVNKEKEGGEGKEKGDRHSESTGDGNANRSKVNDGGDGDKDKGGGVGVPSSAPSKVDGGTRAEVGSGDIGESVVVVDAGTGKSSSNSGEIETEGREHEDDDEEGKVKKRRSRKKRT